LDWDVYDIARLSELCGMNKPKTAVSKFAARKRHGRAMTELSLNFAVVENAG
jgi:hypothetical protein